MPESTPQARLVDVRVPRDPRGLVLVLHGGANRPGNPRVSPTQLSVIRMVPVARRVARTARRAAVVRLLNSHRGWDTTHTPVDDVRWALASLRDRLGALPVCLVGHSLGGRAALVAGGSDGVAGVAALNPWLYPSDPLDGADLSGRRVLFAHGTDDRIASPARSRSVAERLERQPGVEVEWRDVPGGKHAMLRHGRTFETAAAWFCADVLPT